MISIQVVAHKLAVAVPKFLKWEPSSSPPLVLLLGGVAQAGTLAPCRSILEASQERHQNGFK